jgi:hypothetical protein
MRILPFISATLFVLATATAPVQAENLPITHPTVELVKKYFKMVVDQNWKEAAAMIRPASIERKQNETIAIIKRAPTMTDEGEMLGKLGVKSMKELEAMKPEDFYIADRTAFQSMRPAGTDSPDVQKEKKDSLKIEVIGVSGETGGKIVHIVVRTRQEVLEQRINELFFITFEEDSKTAGKWFIAPDLQRPSQEPIKPAAAAAEGAHAAAPAK